MRDGHDAEDMRKELAAQQADGYRGTPLGRIHPGAGEPVGRAFTPTPGFPAMGNAIDTARLAREHGPSQESLRSRLANAISTGAADVVRRESVLNRLTPEIEQTIYVLLDLVDLGLVDLGAALARAANNAERRRHNRFLD